MYVQTYRRYQDEAKVILREICSKYSTSQLDVNKKVLVFCIRLALSPYTLRALVK